MARITDLPPEIIGSILWSIDNVRSLAAALRSCRRFYSFDQQSKEMAIGILRRKISPAIWPYVAALDASWICHEIPDVFLEIIKPFPDEIGARLGESDEHNSAPESRPGGLEEPLDGIEESPDDAEEDFDDLDRETSDSFHGHRSFKTDRLLATRELLEMLFDRPSVLVDKVLSSVTIFDLHVMERRHDKFNSIVTGFAEYAWSRLRENDDSLPQAVNLSSAERDRLCRAIYRLEMYYVLLCDLDSYQQGFLYPQFNWFLFKHSPWENEQIACIYHFLEKEFARASYDVFAHDVAFGHRRVDYLSSWTSNGSRGRWFSQGIEYIYDVTSEGDYESKKRMLERAPGTQHLSFSGTLCSIEQQNFSLESRHGSIIMRFQDGETITTTKEGVLSRVLREKDRDCDLGPRESWFAANLGMPDCLGLLMDGNGWHRDCAYLFWDWDRVERHRFLDLWEKPPVMLHYNEIPGGFKEMRESFVERSKIWQKGGRGYWSKGDTSRIVWPERN